MNELDGRIRRSSVAEIEAAVARRSGSHDKATTRGGREAKRPPKGRRKASRRIEKIEGEREREREREREKEKDGREGHRIRDPPAFNERHFSSFSIQTV